LAPLRIGFVPNLFAVACHAAIAQGFFGAAATELQIVEYTNGSRAAEALDRGDIDCTVGGHLQTITAAERGSDQVFLAPLAFEEPPDHTCISLLGRPGGPSSTAELAGARIAVSAVGAISELQLRVIMDCVGSDYDSLDLLAMPFADMATALRDGTVDAASVAEPFVSQFLENGTARLLDHGSLSRIPKSGQRVMITGLVARRAWTRTHREAARAVVDAVRKGIRFVREHDADTRRMIADYTRIPRQSADAMTLPAFHACLAGEDLQLVVDLAAKFGMIGRVLPAGELIDPLASTA